MRLEHYIVSGGKRLRCGYTTGSAAAGAAKAAALMLLGKTQVGHVQIDTPADIPLTLDVEESIQADGMARCAVRKDGGDDIDATHGMRIFAEVTHSDRKGIEILGGPGVGRVTRRGLEQPVGSAAINQGPRRMIAQAVLAVCRESGYQGGLRVVISAERGEEIAKKTYNARLGIEGGISILGTTGIVEPMSRRAIIETIQKELDIQKAAGTQPLIFVPGNYAQRFLQDGLGISARSAVVCSNFIGEALDYAQHLGFGSALIVGHAGKLVKLAAGVFDTHSHVADARMEVLCTHAAIAGAESGLVADILRCVTVDEALELLEQRKILPRVMCSVMERMETQLCLRSPEMQTQAVMFTNIYGVLGMTSGAQEMIDSWKEADL